MVTYRVSGHTTDPGFLVIAQELHFVVVEVGSVDAQLLAGDPLSAALSLQLLPGHQAGQAAARRCNTTTQQTHNPVSVSKNNRQHTPIIDMQLYSSLFVF